MSKAKNEKQKGFGMGKALEALKEGKDIKRSVWWHGCLRLEKGKYPIDGPAVELINGLHPQYFEFGEANTDPIMPNIKRVTAAGTVINQAFLGFADILAEDWEIVQ